MKKKIVIGMIVYSALFLGGGIYIFLSIESARRNLDRLITLHQVEILREHYLIQIKKVQTDFLLRKTPHSRPFPLVVSHVMNMGRVIETCFDCHHSPVVMGKLEGLRKKTEEYKEALGRVMTIRANRERLALEEENAFRLGESLKAAVGTMIAMTSSKLGEKTFQALEEISRTKNVFYLLMGAIPVLSGIFVFILIKSLTDPMSTLVGSTRRLKAGDLDYRIEGLRDEFGELAGAFNEMTASLKEKIEQMRRTEEKLARANQELKLAQEQMVRAETMAAIGTLSSGISHELTTPLSVILNMAQLTKQEFQENPEVRKDLEIIEYEANQAIKITRSLLGFARSTKSKTETVNVNEVLEDLFKILEFQPRAQATRFLFEPAPDLSPIEAGVGKLRQVFLNVILNGLQAMPAGGTLRVATRNSTNQVFDGVEIAISDTGVGIPKDQIKKIFQPFFTTKEEGTGLGLAITYGIIQEHSGMIEVESEIGQGTTFRISLPKHGPGGRG